MLAWQQRLADVEAGVLGLFQQHDVMSALRQQRGRGAAGRAAADDEDVALHRFEAASAMLTIIPPLMEITWPVM